MHQHNIKRNFLQHHSIPILLVRSIPIGCVVVLLLILCNMFMVEGFGSNGKVYAEEVEIEGDKEAVETSEEVVTSNEVNADISTYAVTSVNPTASLTIGGDAVDKQVITSPGSVGYRSHTVTVDASDIESYSLVISGPTNLVSGTSTTVSGAGNKTPTNMANNTWGYSWGSTTDKESSTYQTLSPVGSSLAGDRVSGFSVSFTKNLFFAAKFASDATPGRYKANVTLSLAATPRAVATGFASISDMQQMTPEICTAAKVGDTGSLEDIRDGSVYTVAKLSDEKCWMTQNLRLVNYATKANDSQTGGFTIPDTASNFSGTNNNAAYYPGNTTYGAYYSWYTATAGTGTAEMESGDASGSICPRGWGLPAQAEYTALRNKGIAQVGDWSGSNSISGYWIGGSSIASSDSAFFIAAGYIVRNSNTLASVGLRGLYWSKTTMADTVAYYLNFENSHVNATTANSEKSYGFSIRCVAR